MGRPSLQADHAGCMGPHIAQGASAYELNYEFFLSFYQIRCSPFFRDLGMEENREGCVFWHLVSSLEHRGHIFMYKRRTKVHFAW